MGLIKTQDDDETQTRTAAEDVQTKTAAEDEDIFDDKSKRPRTATRLRHRNVTFDFNYESVRNFQLI
jgi:hypothetical protein